MLQEQWHAAIDNKPTGPMSIRELKEHMSRGAVTPASLVWRDGFANWTKLEMVKELAFLLTPETAKIPAKPVSPPSRSIASSNAVTAPQPATIPRPVISPKPVVASIPKDFTNPLAQSITDLKRVATSELHVVEPLTTTSSSDALDRTEVDTRLDLKNPQIESHQSSSPQKLPSIRPAVDAVNEAVHAIRESMRVRKAGLPFGAIVLLVGAGAFGVTLAILVFNTWLSPASRHDTKPHTAVTPQPVPATKPAAPFKMAEVSADLPEESLPDSPDPNNLSHEEKSLKESSRSHPSSKKTTKPPSETTTSTASTSTKQLSAKERALLKNMADDSSGPINLQVPNRSTSSTGAAKPLSSSQVRAIVTKHRPLLQRCYEQAARASGSQDTIRIDVRLNVSESGAVTNASLNGPNLGNLKPCILNTVKRWRFPASSEMTEVPFPLVFQPGA